MKIPDAKAAVEKEGKNLRKKNGMEFDESQKQNGSNCRSKEKGNNSSFCVVNGSLSYQEFGAGTKFSKKKKRSSPGPRDIVKDDSGSYAVFTEQGSSASQMTAA